MTGNDRHHGLIAPRPFPHTLLSKIPCEKALQVYHWARSFDDFHHFSSDLLRLESIGCIQ